VQVLADGNRIVRKTTGRVYRDSEGRVRREEDGKGRTSVSIVDPVAGYSYSLDPENKIAWRTPIGVGGTLMNKVEASRVDEMKRTMTAADAEKKAGAVMAARTEQEVKVADERKLVDERKVATMQAGAGAVTAGSGGEVRMRTPGGMAIATMATPGPLEHKTLEGVAVEGRKNTTTIPAGQIGNEQPLTIVSEEWRSPELNVLVVTRHSDPRSGDSSYRLTNIIRAEPDRSLFMVPSDYTVKETGIRKLLEASQRED